MIDFKKYADRFINFIIRMADWLISKRDWFTRKKCITIGSIIGALLLALLAFHIWLHYFKTGGPLVVTVAKVEKKTVPVYLNYVGTNASVRSVDIRARVEGFLIERAFVEGDNVKEGNLMFVIDPREYEAALEQSKGQLAKDKASLAYAKEEVERYTPLVEKEYVTREFYSQKVTNLEKAQAAVEASEGKVENDQLNLSWCRMYSPLNGRIGRTYVHTGNLVGAGEDTKLATIVQLDPIYVYFSPSEEEHRKIMEHKQKGELPVNLSFPDGTKHPYPGKLNFVDNVVDPTTSTIKMRATVPNPEGTLLPGVYANVRLLVTEAPDTLLIPSQAIGEDQGGLYVYVVDKENKVEEKRIEAGATYEDVRAITKGLKEGELVITEGLQLVKEGMEVQTKIADKTKDKNE